MDVDDGDYENSHKNKIKKGPSNYRKYIDSKYMEYNFKMEELEELSTSIVRGKNNFIKFLERNRL